MFSRFTRAQIFYLSIDTCLSTLTMFHFCNKCFLHNIYTCFIDKEIEAQRGKKFICSDSIGRFHSLPNSFKQWFAVFIISSFNIPEGINDIYN